MEQTSAEVFESSHGKRTDVHRPSVIIPEDYEFVAFECLRVDNLGDALVLKAEREKIAFHMQQTGGRYSGHEHGGNCMVCGNVFATYTILFYHAKTNTYVRMGQDCAQKVEMSYGDFNRFTASVRDAIEAKAGKRKAEALLNEQGIPQAWLLYTAENRQGFQWEEVTISDIVGKLVRYGSISEKQVSFVRSLLGKIENRAAIEAQRKAEYEAAADCPMGRVTIKGTVLVLKVVDSIYGESTKVLIRAQEGYKVWGSRFDNVTKGDAVHFTATVEPSKNDTKFGFFKRPKVYVSPEEKKALAAQRKAEREALEAERNSKLANNPNFFNPYSNDYGKVL